MQITNKRHASKPYECFQNLVYGRKDILKHFKHISQGRNETIRMETKEPGC
jgi:hypothetical protein